MIVIACRLLTVGDVMNNIDSKDKGNRADFEKGLYKSSTENRHSLSIQMIDRPDFHLAVSGKTWSVIQEHYPWLIPKVSSFWKLTNIMYHCLLCPNCWVSGFSFSRVTTDLMLTDVRNNVLVTKITGQLSSCNLVVLHR